MVRGAGAHAVEELVPPVQGGRKGLERIDPDPRGGRELFPVGAPAFRVVEVEGLVGPEGGDHHEAVAAGAYGGVMLQRVDGVVGGAHHADVHPADDAAGGKVVAREELARHPPDLPGRVRAEEPVGDAEGVLQLHVGPGVHHVAHGKGHGPGPGHVLLVVRRVAGDEPLVDPEGAHEAPLVVIAVEPDPGEVLELPVLGDLRGHEVVVVVEDRHPLGVLVEQDPCGLVLQQVVLGQETLHRAPPGPHYHGPAPAARRHRPCAAMGAHLHSVCCGKPDRWEAL